MVRMGSFYGVPLTARCGLLLKTSEEMGIYPCVQQCQAVGFLKVVDQTAKECCGVDDRKAHQGQWKAPERCRVQAAIEQRMEPGVAGSELETEGGGTRPNRPRRCMRTQVVQDTGAEDEQPPEDRPLNQD